MTNVPINFIKPLQVFSSLFILMNPVITNDNSAAISFSNYMRNFCLNMVVRTDKTDLSLRNFVNNFKHIALPDLDEDEYYYAISNYDLNYYNDYIFSEQEVISKIIVYDINHNTNLFNDFCDHLCLIATAYSEQNINYKNSIDNFIKLFKEKMTNIEATKYASYNKKEIKNIDPKLSFSKSETSSSISKQTSKLTEYTQKNTIDIQCFARIILPIIIMTGFIIGAFLTKDWVMILIACIPFCFIIVGIKAYKKRCPRCGAWESMKIIKSKRIGYRKVKVRRQLGSGYFRASGNNTYAVRQVFVSADEYTYSEIYRCSICGFEVNGTRRVIDDGIR